MSFIFLPRGGSSYNWYAGFNEEREPNGIIVNYHSVTATIDAQLQGMYDNGQRRIRFLIFHGRGLAGGTNMDSTGGDLPAQCKTNFSNLLAKLIAIGYEEVIVAMAPQGPNRPVDASQPDGNPLWASFDASLYAENFGVVSTVRSLLVASGIAYRLDIFVEGIPPPTYPVMLQYAQTIWSDYVAAFGTSDTLGVSAIPDFRMAQIPAVYQGTYPPALAFDIYDDAENVFKNAYSMVQGFGSGLSALPWIIAESYYNDATVASAFRSAIEATGQQVLFHMQWPIVNGGDSFIPPPLDYWRYLYTLCGISQNLTTPDSTAPTSTVQVAIGPTASDTVANLADAINANPDTSGASFSSYAVSNPSVVASASGTTLTILGIPGQSSDGTPIATGGSILGTIGTPTGGVDGGVSPQSVAESSNPESVAYQWTYQAGGDTISLGAGQLPPATGETIFVEYKPVGFGIVTVDSPAEIASRATAEGGSGIYENLAIREDLLTVDEGTGAAQALLASYGQIAQRISFVTDTYGLLPGQVVFISSDKLGVTGEFLIQSVQGTAVGPNFNRQHFRYSVVAVTGTRPQTAVGTFAALANASGVSGAVSAVGSSAKSPAIVPGLGGAAATAGWRLNFGIDDDTAGVDPIGKFAPFTGDGQAFTGYVTVERIGPAETIIDVLFSSDFGENWTSLFGTNNANKIIIPAEYLDQDIYWGENPRVREITNFAENAIKKGWIARLDVIQSGGATGIEVYLEGKPSGARGTQLTFDTAGIYMTPLLP